MRVLRVIAVCVLGVSAHPLAALTLSLPDGAQLLAEQVSDPDSYDLPLDVYSDGALPVETVEGRVVKQAWRIEQPGLTTLQVISAVQEQLQGLGYQTLVDCADFECGGFDFRFNIDVLPAPDMYVDLFDYRFVSARAKDAQVVSALVSLSATGAVRLQIIHAIPKAGSGSTQITTPGTSEALEDDAGTSGLIDTLMQKGHVILGDLDFGTGADSLENGPYASLRDLAGFLLEDTARRIVLVGHTDFVGSLADNIQLSKARAEAVRVRLIQTYGVPDTQLEAEGIGYLSPIAPNTVEAGREVNRRVEAVLLSLR